MISLALIGCALPRNDADVLLHDFGPGARQAKPGDRMAALPALELAPVQASTALGGTALLYRLMYADAQQPQAYARSRWSVPPAQLVDQRLRERLGLRRAVLHPGAVTPPRSARAASAALAATAEPALLKLQVELEEFSQLFDTPDSSSALVRLRATVLAHRTTGDALMAQRSFIVQQSAPTADASGGVQALAATTDQAIAELETWLAQLPNQ